MEISTGSFDENDIVRLEDDYRICFDGRRKEIKVY